MTIEPSQSARGRTPPSESAEVPPLKDFIDVPKLQAMQDLFAELTGTCVVVRDIGGESVTRVSRHNPICDRLLGTEAGRRHCRESSTEAATEAIGRSDILLRRCFAGLTQLTAPVRANGHHLGSIVIGHLNPEETDEEVLTALAHNLETSPKDLRSQLDEVRSLSRPRLRQAVELFSLMVNSLAELCVRGAEVNRTVRQLTTLHEISQLLSSARRLDEVLSLTTETLTKTLNLKACAIRLLDESSGELTMRSAYNLSDRYQQKGPVVASQSPFDQEAMQGKVVQVPDITADDRFLYKQAMLDEGIRSIFYVGLLSRGKPLGALRLYSREVRRLDASEERLFAAVANQVAAAIENAHLYHETLEKERLEYELGLAASIQEQLLPRSQPRVAGYDIHGLGVPCELIGGDFYDFIPAPAGRLGLTIADGAGKGVPGALLTAIAHTALRVHTEHITSPREILTRTNKQLCARTRPGQFVTLFYGLLNPLTATFTYANAGHNPPVLYSRGQWEALQADGIILGVDENASFEQREKALREGDVLVLYTDGITEAMNDADELFGEGRLREVIAAHAADLAEEIADEVVQSVSDFVGGQPQHDDIALVVLKVCSE